MVFGLETHTLKVCAAPAHTIQLEVASGRYQNGPMDMESVSKCFGPLRQPIRVLYRRSCTIGCGLWARYTHFEDVCSSNAHDSARSSQQAVPEWSNGHGKCFKALRPLETTDPSAILRQSVVGFGLEAHTLRMCAAPAHTIQLEVPTMRTRMVQWTWKVFQRASAS